MSRKDSVPPLREQLQNLITWLEAAEEQAELVESCAPLHLEAWFVRSRATLRLLLSLCRQLQRVALTGGVLEAVLVEAMVACRVLQGDIDYLEDKGHQRHLDPAVAEAFRAERRRKAEAWSAFSSAREAVHHEQR